jgi:hypothetical protein
MAADSAEWYVEAALNYSHADISVAYNDATVDSLTYTIELLDGLVNEADAWSAYNSLGSLIGEANATSESHVIIVDITSAVIGNQLTLTAAYVIGSGYDKALDTSFGPDDHWMWMGSSNCNCKSPPLSPAPNNNHLCADKRIQQRINNELIAMGNGVYMVSVETWTVFTYTDEATKHLSYDEFPDSNSPYGYMVYTCSGGGCSNCLTPSDMSYYTQSNWDIMASIHQQYCPSKLRQSCTITGDVGGSFYIQRAQFRYGLIPRS